MVCEDYAEDDQRPEGSSFREAGSRFVERLGRRRWLLAGESAAAAGRLLPRAAAAAAPRAAAPPAASAPPAARDPAGCPFIGTMDEISYWIITKRAPCLMNFENTIKKRDSHNSHSVPNSHTESTTPKKKKKRKLSILDDDSPSEKQQNVYFDTSQNQKTVQSSCKSDTLGSDIEFNIRNSSIQHTPKKLKLQRNARTTLHKKNKVITSTPKSGNLRRSLRKVQRNMHYNSKLNNSLQIFHVSENYGNNLTPTKKYDVQCIRNNTHENNGPEGPVFEDLSDVSGFTANYIRSTKIHTKTPRQIRCKQNRSAAKEIKTNGVKPREDKMVMCVSKAVNTTTQKTVLNCSTDSSQNVLNLVTIKNNEPRNNRTRGTSVLKFVDPKTDKEKNNRNEDVSKLDITFQTQSSMPRYPRRSHTAAGADGPSPVKTVHDSRSRDKKNSKDLVNSHRKENPEDQSIRTRSGRTLGLAVRPPDNSLLVVSQSEQLSSLATVNVASPHDKKDIKKKCVSGQKGRVKKSDNSKRKVPQRDKSGFNACFSDSDDDEPLIMKKFFF